MIALADCNNFYASCERVFNPKIKSKPVIVLSNNDGCVIARSNEAKTLGIKMGEPVFKIRNIIDQNKVYIFSTNFALYGDMSNRVMSLLNDMVPSLEVYSIDEAFLDFDGIRDYSQLAYNIKTKIQKSTGIPISIGVAKTKTLAKIANYIAKKNSKNNIFIINENSNFSELFKKISISNLWGIGNSYSFILNNYGVKTIYDFMCLNESWVQNTMNIVGLKMLRELKGESCFPIDANPSTKKNISTSRTFKADISDMRLIKQAVSNHAVRCAEKLRKQKSSGRYIGVFLKTNPFKKQARYHSAYNFSILNTATNDSIEIVDIANKLLKSIYKKGCKYKKSGVIISDIVPENQVQLNLFNNPKKYIVRKKLFDKIDLINRTMGRDKVRILAQGIPEKMKQKNLSPCYTTRWEDLLRVS